MKQRGEEREDGARGEGRSDESEVRGESGARGKERDQIKSGARGRESGER